jgi:glycosyltransferase involved in cell wall biosynthesis
LLNLCLGKKDEKLLAIVREKKPLVSVIIPAYNRADTINRAIQSVINQTYATLEIIVIDDASTDGTDNIIKNINDNRIVYVRHDFNKGVSAARNTGIKISKGVYIALLDSDDEWMPEKTAIQLKALLKHNTSVIAGCTGHYKKNNSQSLKFQAPNHIFWFKWLLFQCLLSPGSTLMADKKAFKKVGYFDEKLTRFEDWDWLIRYTENFPFIPIREPLAVVHLGNPPRAKIVQHSAMVFMEKNKEKFYSLGIWYGRKIMARRFLDIGMRWLIEKNFRKGSFFILKGLIYFPFQPPYLFLRKIMELKQLHNRHFFYNSKNPMH